MWPFNCPFEGVVTLQSCCNRTKELQPLWYLMSVRPYSLSIPTMSIPAYVNFDPCWILEISTVKNKNRIHANWIILYVWINIQIYHVKWCMTHEVILNMKLMLSLFILSTCFNSFLYVMLWIAFIMPYFQPCKRFVLIHEECITCHIVYAC